MSWKDWAPWAGVVGIILVQVGGYAVTKWRVGALDRFRADTEATFDRLHEWRGEVNVRLESLEARQDRVERQSDREASEDREHRRRSTDH